MLGHAVGDTLIEKGDTMNRMPLVVIAMLAVLALVIGVAAATPSIPIPPP